MTTAFTSANSVGFKDFLLYRVTCPKGLIDLGLIDARIKELDSARASRAYQRQKTPLESKLSSFLASFQPQKTLFSATPKDVVHFLVWKDGKGKTMVHSDSCQFLGLQAKQTCNCPTRLSAGTVDSLIGKLRSHAGLAWV